MSKHCSKCKIEKQYAEFHASTKASDAKASWCKKCVDSIPRNRGNYSRDYSPEQKRRWQLKTRYGLTPEQVEDMKTAQSGKCKICMKVLVKFHIDHCHTTGKVRGLLCHGCNLKLAGFDDPIWRKAAMAYLGIGEIS